MNAAEASDDPFQMLFEKLGRLPVFHAESVNGRAYEYLTDLLSVPVEKPGRCILLRAPRAGHGKTHLLSRIEHFLGSTHEFIPLRPTFGNRIDAVSVMDDAIRVPSYEPVLDVQPSFQQAFHPASRPPGSLAAAC